MKLKLPSFRQIIEEMRLSLLRFPFVFFVTAIGTTAALILVDFEGPPGPSIFFNILFAAVLGIPLLITIVITSEKRNWSNPVSLGVQIAGILVLAVYGATVPSDMVNAPSLHVVRLLMFAAGLLLLAAVAPFIGKGEINGFWHYNKSLFLRALMAALYTCVLYAGLALALAALDNLFGIHISGKRYLELWIFIVGFFATWFFLSGVPRDLAELDARTDYPKALKVFTQSILFPLVIVYLVILYAYLAKILISWDWPKGWVSRLILGYATTGIFSLLLLHPLRERLEDIWIKTTSRLFYVAMLPLIAMLFLAIWRRASEYGITIDRYIAIVLSIWLLGITLYFILSKAKNIKVIPLTLCLLAFIVTFGPWGMFRVPEKSQVARLKGILEKDSVLVDGIVRKYHKALSYGDINEISAIISYLHEFHGYDGIQPWFTESLCSDTTGTKTGFKDPALVTKLMGVDYTRSWEFQGTDFRILTSNPEKALSLEGYTKMLPIQSAGITEVSRSFLEEGVEYRFSKDLDSVKFRVLQFGVPSDSMQFALKPFVDKLLKDYSNANTDKIPPEKMMIDSSTQMTKLRIWFKQIQVRRRDNELKPSYIEACILYKITPQM